MRINNLKILTITTSLVFISVIFFIDNFTKNSRAKLLIQVNNVPAELLSYNKLGELYRKLGLVETIDIDSNGRYKKGDISSNNNLSLFNKRRRVTNVLLTSKLKNEDELLNIDKELVSDQDNILSINIKTNKDNLTGIEGILTNHEGRGRKWEKLSYIGIKNDGKIIARTAAGIRLHGGKSRSPIWPTHSYKVYFRKVYGDPKLNSNSIFPNISDLKSIVIHNSIPYKWPINNLIANDLFSKIGVTTLPYSPAKFTLNGEYQGLYWVTPHTNKEQIQKIFDLNEIHYHKYKGDKSDKYLEETNVAFDYSKDAKSLKLKSLIDTNQLINHIIAVTFSGTTDWNQGMAYKEKNKTNDHWSFIAWDLDHSFVDWTKDEELKQFYKKTASRPIWKQQGLSLVMHKELDRIANVRQLIFRRLIKEDNEFKEQFIKRYISVLNHELGRNSLDKFLNKYKTLLAKYGEYKLNPLMIDFFKFRSQSIRDELVKEFQLEKLKTIYVNGKYKFAYIDGHKHQLPYTGKHLTGTTIEIKPLNQNQHETGQVHKKIIDKDLKILL